MDQPHDSDGYPYQIWHYYRAGKYSDKRFIFYLPDTFAGITASMEPQVVFGRDATRHRLFNRTNTC